jgi:signal transduction histidine kinase
VLTVADEGPGIPPADVSASSSVSTASTRRGRATRAAGLGLAIVKHLVERMDGSVEAANRDRGGAIFTIYIPLTPTAQPVAS